MSESSDKHALPAGKSKQKQENLWVNLAFNIIVPAIILSRFSNDEYLGITAGLLVALAFPLAYGVMDFFQRDKINIFSVLGVISTLLTGSISLLKLGPEYIAIKEAAIPAIIGIAVLVSTWTPYPLVSKLILNDNVFDLERLQAAIDLHNGQSLLDAALRTSSYLVAFSFAFSSTLNYLLATWIVVSDPGTAAYNEQLGKLTALSYPVIALPSTLLMAVALFYLMHRIKKITGHNIEDYLILGHHEKG